ncbi:MAG TPA: hypothetical protein VGZ26_03790 [Pirellulales bacterium]|nr:hypothetical protein [Pirellulales bacterium]
MKRLSMPLMLLVLPIVLAGCSKGPAHQQPDRADAKVDPVEQDQRAIELNAQRAKQDIDAMKAEAEDAVRRTRQSLTAKASKATAAASDVAAEVAEDAKDRAEDVPDAVDRLLEERQSDLRSRIRQRLEAEQRAVEQEDSDSNR